MAMAGIQDLFSKEMTRKEFITTLGFGLVFILGFSTLMELLGKKNPFHAPIGRAFGYSSGFYSGFKRRQIK